MFTGSSLSFQLKKCHGCMIFYVLPLFHVMFLFSASSIAETKTDSRSFFHYFHRTLCSLVLIWPLHFLYSYLGYGLLAARAGLLNVTGQSGNPCILAGYDGMSRNHNASIFYFSGAVFIALGGRS